MNSGVKQKRWEVGSEGTKFHNLKQTNLIRSSSISVV